MKLFTREFSSREKTLLAVLLVVIAGALYFKLVDQPARIGLDRAQTEAKALQAQLDEVNRSIAAIEGMETEINGLDSRDLPHSRMPSYNAGDVELDFLNRTLDSTSDYYVGFDQVSRSGDLIRRDFSLQFRTKNYKKAIKVIKRLEGSELRCLIGDMSISSTDKSEDILKGPISASCTATFYETMQGGVPDSELPAAEEETSE